MSVSTDALSIEEQQLMERLRNKYSSGPCVGGACGSTAMVPAYSAAHPPLPTSWESSSLGAVSDSSRVRKMSGVDAKVCGTCKGMGTYHEEYNFRRMEKFCNDCDGKGVNLYKEGVEVKETASEPKIHGSCTTRESKLKADIMRLEGKVSEYQLEKQSVEASMDGAGEEKRTLLVELLQQIDLQLQRLQGAVDRKINELNGSS